MSRKSIDLIPEKTFYIDSLTILPGTDKDGVKESFKKINVCKGEVVALVGPIGSGKSRLLSDIEWFYSGDSPTHRKIFINKEKNILDTSFNSSNLVGKLSQNMNFFLDLTVREFIKFHSESIKKNISSKTINFLIEQANNLAGEPFTVSSHLTELSGGQARALMIVDMMFISNSPIILIDEFENVGINKIKTLKLMLKENKITFISTHDPLIALMAQKRLILKNGAIHKIIQTSKEENAVLKKLVKLESEVLSLQKKLRKGERLIT